MTDKSEITKSTTPLLPRSAWNSQLSYLKILLKTKQTLDKSEKQNNTENNQL